MAKRRYSDGERAAALAALDANGGNLTRTARELGIPKSSIEGWRNDPDAAAPPEVRTQKRADLAGMLLEFIEKSVPMLAAKFESADFRDGTTGLAILIDKMQLLRGEATAIHEQRDTARMAEFESRYAAAESDAADGEAQPPHPPHADRPTVAFPAA